MWDAILSVKGEIVNQTFHGRLILVYTFCLKLLPCLCKMVGIITGLSEGVCAFRDPEFCSAVAAGATCNERWSDGGLHGGHHSLHAQFQLQYWHGMPGGSVWALHRYGECQRWSYIGAVVSVGFFFNWMQNQHKVWKMYASMWEMKKRTQGTKTPPHPHFYIMIEVEILTIEAK